MSDIDISFDVNPLNGEIQTLSEEQSVKQRIKTLVKTSLYERLFWPNVGCQARSSIFELYSKDLTEYTIRRSILLTINYQEPRVKDVEVVVEYDNISTVRATVNFVVRNTNVLQSVDVFMDRQR